MGKYRGPTCRLARRERTDLGLKSGVRDLADKCNFERLPGMHWQRRGRTTDYGVQLRMKQLIRRYYGILERQLRSYYKKADKASGSTGDNLLLLLESRLDNVVYRMGFASTRAEARQLVSHKSIIINGSLVNIPSYHVTEGDVIAIRPRACKQLRIKQSIELYASREKPQWLTLDHSNFTGTFTVLPEIAELPDEFKVNLVVEFYSK